MTPRKSYTLALPGRAPLLLGERTLVMGIVNVTPDSFAEGSDCLNPARAVDRVLALEDAGADLIDIGGESTRPGAVSLSADEELRRIMPVLERIDGRVSVPISVDTYKGAVADAALDQGAVMINDISALDYDPTLLAVVSGRGVPIILMHNRGRSHQMYREASYRHVGSEVVKELSATIDRAVKSGVKRDQIVIDPGLGFAKRSDHTTAALADLPLLKALDRPILVGPSRKSFLMASLGDRSPSEREWGTAGAVAVAVLFGAHIVRVHAVASHGDVVRVVDAVRAACLPSQPGLEPALCSTL